MVLSAVAVRVYHPGFEIMGHIGFFAEGQKVTGFEGVSTQRSRRGRPPNRLIPDNRALSLLGWAMRDAREATGASLSEFAVQIGYSPSHLSRVEHGKATPSPELLEAYETRCGSDGLLGAQYTMVREEQAEDRARRRGAQTESRMGPSPGSASSLSSLEGDRSEFVMDVTIPDLTELAAGAEFSKTWRIRNAGSVPWHGRALKLMGPRGGGPGVIKGPSLVPVPDTEPGSTVDITAECRAPEHPGTTIARWKMVDADGRLCFPDKYPLGIYVEVVVPRYAPPL